MIKHGVAIRRRRDDADGADDDDDVDDHHVEDDGGNDPFSLFSLSLQVHAQPTKRQAVLAHCRVLAAGCTQVLELEFVVVVVVHAVVVDLVAGHGEGDVVVVHVLRRHDDALDVKGGATAELVTGATVAVAIGAALIEAGAITGANVAVATGAAYVVAGATTGAKVAVATGAAELVTGTTVAVATGAAELVTGATGAVPIAAA